MDLNLSDETISKIVDNLISRSDRGQKTESEKKLRNVKNLLQNYKLLENHLNVSLPTLEDDVQLSKYELSLYSLLGYRARSKEMMMFINKILDEYKRICIHGSYDTQRQYDVIKSLYLNDKTLTYTTLAEKYHVDEKTIRRDEKKAINKLSVMIFGVDSINDMSK